MKQIDKYVNSIYKDVSGDKQEIEDLRQEMRYFAVIKNSEVEGNKISKKLFTQGQEGTGESGLIRQGIAGEDTWYVEWEYETYDYLQYEPFYYIFFAISGVLFILWGIINFYHRTRLKTVA